MGDFTALLGLVFVVLLFNFTYPQNALDLLLKGIGYHALLPRTQQKQSLQILEKIKGWFFLTDFVQFIATYFIGVFVTSVFVFFYLPMTRLCSIVALVVSTLSIGFYVVMCVIAVHKASSYSDAGGMMKRKEWILGRPPFTSQFPLRALSAMGIITLLVLVATIGAGSMFLRSDGAFDLRPLLIGMATIVIVLLYLINYWGLYVYMPYSSVAILASLSATPKEVLEAEGGRIEDSSQEAQT